MPAGDYQGTYAAEKVIFTVGGVILSGWTDGDYITVKYDEDRYMSKAGADGEVGRSKNASRMGTFEAVLSSSSKANDELSAIFNLAQIGGIDNPIPIAMADLSGRDVAFCSNGWLKTTPDMVKGKEIGDRTWTFQAADLTMNFGGNS